MKHNSIKFATHLLKPASIIFTHTFNNVCKQRIILAYHGISKKPQFNCVTVELFEQQISYLKEKYSVVPLYKLVGNLKSFSVPEVDLASITFDDGYVNFAEFAVPILEKYGFHATVFVPTGKVGYFNDWDECSRGFKKMPIMSYEQLHQLPEKIAEIGSHGISHTPLNRLTEDKIDKEIVESRMEIEQKVGRQVRFFAFPFGRYLNSYRSNKNLLLSYNAACTSWWGRYNSMKDLYALRRIGIWDSDSLRDFIDKLEGNYDWLIIKEKIGRFYKYVTLMQKQ
jgi:peptidoglycan/xylan/chitin deacetylase (PgdA/CDA1 family)